MKNRLEENSLHEVLAGIGQGYVAVQHGGMLALGFANEQGGLSATHFPQEYGSYRVKQLMDAGIDAELRPTGSPGKYAIVFPDPSRNPSNVVPMKPNPDFGALSQLTDEQRNAVIAFREQHGRNWKEKLGSLWLSPRSQGPLHVVRNTLGPEWLQSVREADFVALKKAASRYLVVHPKMGICLDGSTGSDLSRQLWSKDKMLPEEYANFAVTFTSAEIAGLKEYFGHAAWADELQAVEVVPDMDLNCVSMQECVRLGLDAWEVCKLYSIKANKADEGFLNSLGVKFGDFDDETGGYLVRLDNAAIQRLTEFKADFPIKVVNPFPVHEPYNDAGKVVPSPALSTPEPF